MKTKGYFNSRKISILLHPVYSYYSINEDFLMALEQTFLVEINHYLLRKYVIYNQKISILYLYLDILIQVQRMCFQCYCAV